MSYNPAVNPPTLLNTLQTALPALAPDALRALAQGFAPFTCDKGTPLLREGEVWRQVLWIERGALRLFFNRRDGREFNKNFYLEGAAHAQRQRADQRCAGRLEPGAASGRLGLCARALERCQRGARLGVCRLLCRGGSADAVRAQRPRPPIFMTKLDAAQTHKARAAII